MCDKIDAWIIDHLSVTAGHLQGMVGLLHQCVAFLCQRSPRKKRRLLNFIGDLSSSLFCMATEEDVRKIAAVNSRLAGAVEGLFPHQMKS